MSQIYLPNSFGGIQRQLKQTCETIDAHDLICIARVLLQKTLNESIGMQMTLFVLLLMQMTLHNTACL